MIIRQSDTTSMANLSLNISGLIHNYTSILMCVMYYLLLFRIYMCVMYYLHFLCTTYLCAIYLLKKGAVKIVSK